jgi:glycerol uptake facilitator-like aquaporin
MKSAPSSANQAKALDHARLSKVAPSSSPSLSRRLATEGVGTAFLLIAVVGAGIMGERLAGDGALTLLASALTTGAALFALITWLGPISGAHLNPLVTLAMVWRGDLPARQGWAYGIAQSLGGVIGVVLANVMFGLPALAAAAQVRTGPAAWLSEFVSTFGLIGAVWTCAQLRLPSAAAVVATYMGAAFWFTATSFANPAVSLARAFTDSFSGIRLVDVPGFVAAELAGAIAAIVVFRWLTAAIAPTLAPLAKPTT